MERIVVFTVYWYDRSSHKTSDKITNLKNDDKNIHECQNIESHAIVLFTSILETALKYLVTMF